MPFALFMLLTGFGLALCIWTSATAATRVTEHSGTHRAWTFVAATLLPPATACAALSAVFGRPELQPIIVLLPILIIAGTWANMMTLRDQGLHLKLLHLPVIAFNTCLAGIYAVRAGQELSGFDLGTWGTAITGGHSLLQTWVGHRQAGAQAIWLHLPFLLPLWLRYRRTHFIALSISSMMSLAMLGLLVLSMPISYQRAELFRQPPANSLPIILPQLGIKVDWGDRILPDSTRDHRRSQFLGLAADCLVVDVGPELFTDPALFRQTQAEIELARESGAEIVLICRPPLEFQWLPATDLSAFCNEMRKIHWQAAEQLDPDLLVLYAGPFGQLLQLSKEFPTIDQWHEQILRGVREVKRANANVRVAVAFENSAAHARELFSRLAADGSPLDVLGFLIHATDLDPVELQDQLPNIDQWCAESETVKPIWIFEAGASPLTTGGELGQWRFLKGLLQNAARSNRLEGFCIDALRNGIDSYGIIANAGRQRLTYRKLRDLLMRVPPGSPK